MTAMFRGLLITIVACASLAPALCRAQPDTSEGRYKIQVLTMGKGEDLFARFGHIALTVDDKVSKTGKVYNFGTFSFNDPELQIKYARGFLIYWVSVTSYRSIIDRYRYFDREVTVRTLNLTPKQAQEVAHRLDINALPENREYEYRHYIDNCCTRIRDIIDDAVGGAIKKKHDREPTGRTYRDWTLDALEGLPVSQAIIVYSLGSAIDKPITRWDEQFLPSVLATDLDEIRIGPDNHPLVTRKRVVVKRQGPAVESIAPTYEIAIPAVLLGLLALGFLLPIALGKRRIAARLTGLGLLVWGLTAGLGGLMLLLYWTATTHFDTHYNENLLVNPFLHLWLLGPAFKLIFKARLGERTSRLLRWYLIASMGLILFDVIMKIGPFIQGNWGVIAFATACNLLALSALVRTGAIRRF